MNSHAPVILEWGTGPGIQRRAEGRTRVVNFYGCLVQAAQDLGLGQRLRLTNLANNRSSEAKVVWKGKEGSDGWELGIELLNPGVDFWGLDL
ncbi:MAG: hypothetical protein WBC04_03915 [Candidatus Acidiferrales bacterium]